MKRQSDLKFHSVRVVRRRRQLPAVRLQSFYRLKVPFHTARFCSEERLEHFVDYFRVDAGARIHNAYHNRFSGTRFGPYLENARLIRVAMASTR
jgi:hypothetical protein